MVVDYNVVIIGAGAAGLLSAIYLKRIKPELKILLISKSSSIEESNTYYAKGGIAAPISSSDSIDAHINDTLKTGAGLCNEETVSFIIGNSQYAIKELIDFGVPFDIKGNFFDLGREGGHSTSRVLHVGDTTGKYLIFSLYKKTLELNVSILFNFFVYNILISQEAPFKVLGVWKNKYIAEIRTDFIIIATGGIGYLYKYTSNPRSATGDGISLAHKLNLPISGMEFIQFHPTALLHNQDDPLYLITEAVRGKGAIIVDDKHERFLFNYTPMGELAPRDTISYAIYEKISNNKRVFLSMKNIDKNVLTEFFPSLVAEITKRGYNPFESYLPIIPAAHYLCGGINASKIGETSIPGILVNGECANTGLHGANRLASNSLLEIAVLSKFIAKHIATQNVHSTSSQGIKFKEVKINHTKDHLEIINSLRTIMYKNAYVVRTNENLNYALSALSSLDKDISHFLAKEPYNPNFIETSFMITTAALIIKQSLARENSIGCFIKKSYGRTTQNHKRE